VIKGNHDTFLNLYFIKKEIKFLESYEFKEDKIQVIVLHGHKNIELNENCLYIIGHDHPAIGIKKGTTYEQYKCFLIGKTSKSYIILPPSFTDVSVGTNVLKGVFLSPILNKLQKTDEHFINKCDVIINESNEFYHFKINDLINI
jgi:putative SbcD/Mre11-related phosphoesterase